MSYETTENQSLYTPKYEVKTREEFFHKLGKYKITDLTNQKNKGEYREFSLPIEDDVYYNPSEHTFSIKKTLFDQINEETNKEANPSTTETQSVIETTKIEASKVGQEAAITSQMKPQIDDIQEGIFEVTKEKVKTIRKEYETYKKTIRKIKTQKSTPALTSLGKQIDTIIEDLKNIEKGAKGFNKKGDTDLSVYAQALQNYEKMLISDQVKDAIQKASLGERVTLRTPIYSAKDAKKALELQNQAAKENEKKRALLAQIIALHLFNDNQSALADFINGTMTDEKKLNFIITHKQQLETLQQRNKAVYQELEQTTGLTAFVSNKVKQEIYTTPSGGGGKKEGREYENGRKALENRGLFGRLDYLTKDLQLKDPKSQQFYRSAGNLCLAAGGLFLTAKAVQTLWYKLFGSEEKRKKANWSWITVPALAILATGGRPADIFRGGPAMEGIFGWLERGVTAIAGKRTGSTEGNTSSEATSPKTDAEKKQDEQETLIHSEAVPATMAIFSGMQYNEIYAYLEKKDSTYRLKDGAYDALLLNWKNQLQADDENPQLSGQQRTALEGKIKYLEQVGKEDKKQLISKGLTGMGIAQKLEANKDSTTLAEDDMVEYIVRMASIGSVEFEKISNDPTKQAMFVSHCETGKPTLEELKKAGVFIPKISDTSHTQQEIKTLGLFDSDAYLIQKACNEIYTTYGPEAKTLGIHFRKEGDDIIFTSYDKEIKINLTTKTLEGLTTGLNPLIFNDTGELIKAANFINAIKYHSRFVTAKANPRKKDGKLEYDDHPFYISNLGNLEFRGTGGDSTTATGMPVFLTRRLPKLENAIHANSPTLNNHKPDFVRYLNTQNPPFWLKYTN